MADEQLYVPGYPGQGESVSPAFRQNGGGGGGGFSLPYQYLIETDHNVGGSLDSNWSESGDTTGSRSIVVPPSGISMTPSNECCLRVENDGTSRLSFELPGAIDVSAGFRSCVWYKGEIDAQANFSPMWSDNPFVVGEDHNLLQFSLNLVGAEVGSLIHRENDSNLGVIDMGDHSSLGGWHWQQLRLEYVPASSIARTWVYQSSGGQARHVSGDKAITGWPAAMYESMQYFCINVSGPGTYTGDVYLIGFWVGQLADGWPSVIGTPTA